MKILIIQPKKGMGDMIIYLPYIHAISKNYKKSVSLLVKDNSSFFKSNKICFLSVYEKSPLSPDTKLKLK